MIKSLSMLWSPKGAENRRPHARHRRSSNRRRFGAVSLAVESLEQRQVMATLVALTLDNSLLTFDSNDPETILHSTRISGLQSVGERIIGIDYRSATGELYAASARNLYSVDAHTGVATLEAPLTPIRPFGREFGFDFNPTVDRLRVVSDFDQNLRYNPNTGVLADGDLVAPGIQPDGELNYAAGDRNFGADPFIVGSAYTNPDNDPATGTTLYGIDADLDILVTQNPPNAGTLNTVGRLGINAGRMAGFDVGADGVAYASLSRNYFPSKLYTVNLATGAASLVGDIGFLKFVRDIAVVQPKQTVYGVASGNTLVSFNSTAPGVLTSSTPISGLGAGETVVGIDFRPATGELYAVGSSNRLYTIDTATGEATAGATLIAAPGDDNPFMTLGGTSFGVDFNPTVDRLRVVSNADQNLRINVDTGEVTTDANLNPGEPSVTASAYTSNFAGATTTSLYGIDSTANTLVQQTPPNNGTLVSIGALGVDPTAVISFDVGANGIAYAALQLQGETTSRFYSINLATGAATEMLTPNAPAASASPIGGVAGGAQLVGSIAIAPAIVELKKSRAIVIEGNPFGGIAGGIPGFPFQSALVVTRTGDTSGTSTVTFAVANRTAIFGKDFRPAAGVVTFAPGETVKTIPVEVIDDNVREPIETALVTIGTPTGGGGATLGGRTSTWLTILDDEWFGLGGFPY